MKLNHIKRFIVLLLMTYCCGQMVAQQANTLYFMQGVSERSIYNPAFQAPYSCYIDLPVMPNFGLSIGNNSLVFDDIVFNNADKSKTIQFLHPEALAMGKRQGFYDALRSTTRINGDFSLNLLGFGFKSKKNFFTFDITLKEETGLYMPKDFFKMLLFGTGEQTRFDLGKFGINASVYTEVSLGFSRQVSDKWSWGAKLKYLTGLANVSTDIKRLDLNAGIYEWSVNGDGKLNASLPQGLIDRDKLFDSEGKLDFTNVGDAVKDKIEVKDFKPADFLKNYGVGADLGFAWKIVPQLQFSLAVTDFGFIHWGNNTVNAAVSNGYKFPGVGFVLGDTWEGTKNPVTGEIEGSLKKSLEDELDKLKGIFEDVNSAASGKAYNTLLSTRLNAGLEYGLFNNKIGIGLLSSTLYTNKAFFPELTASLNFRPWRWFQPTISYSILDGGFKTLGAGAQLRVGPFNMYMAIDKIPVGKEVLEKQYYIPKYMNGTNLYAGMSWVFGPSKKKCFDVPKGWIVDKYGCPIDSDGDGVPDSIDECPNTPQGVEVDAKGCPIDSDKDGVPDYLDECPDTPLGVVVDAKGCPVDTDGDGVPDYLDECPGTPAGVKVDSRGCPIDSDGDGVPDYLDECPDTPRGVAVDARGCPFDTDGDGVPDYLDKCPNIPGPASNNGCPELKAKEKATFEKAMHGIKFATGSAVITKASYPILDAVVLIMNENPIYHLIINGHTDNVGKPESNQLLSERRAASVRDYIVKKGIASERILKVQGFGQTQPMVENTTAANKQLNRRVEFIVKYEKEVEAK